MAFHDQINRLYNGQKVPQDRVVSEQCEAGEFYLTQGKVFAFRISFMEESIRGTRFLGPLDSDLWRSYDFENRICASITEARGFKHMPFYPLESDGLEVQLGGFWRLM